MDVKDFNLLNAQITLQVQAIDRIIVKVQQRKGDYDQDPRFAESLAYQLHNLYCAFEDLFKIVAQFFENSIEDEARFHIQLLQRMTLDIEGVRPPLLSRDLFRALDELRAFRHVFRHAYSYDIDLDKLYLVLVQYEYIETRYTQDIQRFLHLLQEGVDDSSAISEASPECIALM